ncbi:MAG: hypothetical protein ABIW79_04185 [Gemmatimonas sp.]
MTTEELHQLIARLPGGRRVTIVTIENTATASTDSDLASTGGPIVGAAGQYIAASIRPSAGTPLEIALEALCNAPTSRRTPVEWSKAFDGAITVREVKRALEHEVLPYEERGEGRGHGALVVTPAAMVTYLKARDEAISSRGKRPIWFAHVVKGATNAS